MLVCKCDRCKKEITEWLIIETRFWTNLSPLSRYAGTKEVCEDCYKEMFNIDEVKNK